MAYHRLESASAGAQTLAQNEAGKTVLDGDVLEAPCIPRTARPDPTVCRCLAAGQAALVYPFTPSIKGWMDAVIALQAAFVTGVFVVSSSREHAIERHKALQEAKKPRVEIARLKAVATKEKQMARQVELNLEIRPGEGRIRSTGLPEWRKHENFDHPCSYRQAGHGTARISAWATFGEESRYGAI